ncbi:universal stress protein [Flagellimonas allohymeniacidonis]|uniref:Universal stress protein n=1 Tax=Flagellimonas allohymeniacidonis TaxID=2517819 RepID=A0A4Q8QDH4_9FLAO|nr:universal stress protein [Allomuricauda hymeniacidonis]TAI48431.1 universal stress protein [Allomuricauda hymeniacidonis]
MERILVPVDFSDYSKYALEVAAQIAGEKKMQITVLHMIGISPSRLALNESEEQKEAEYYMDLAKKHFAKFLNEDFLKGVKLELMVQNYKIFSEINAIVREHHIDLVVMGSHGESGLLDSFVGSNTEKVVRTSDIPVLVVKKKISNFKLDSLVFAWNFKEEILNVYKRAKKFADFFSARLYPVYVNRPTLNFKSDKELTSEIDEIQKEINLTEEVVIYSDYSVEKGVLHYAEKIHADAVVIPTHGRRGLAHFFLGSIGEDIANRANIPVITFKTH